MAEKKRRNTTTRSVAVVEETTDSVARRTFVSLWVALGFVITLWFIYQVRQVLVWLVIALVIALALAPFVDWMVREGLKRGLSALLTVILTLLLLTGLVTAAASPLVSEGGKLIDNFPQYVEDVTKNDTIKKFDDRFNVTDKVKDVSKDFPQFLSGAKSPIVDTAKSTFSAAITTGVIFTLALFMLIEGPASWQRFVAILRPRDSRRVDRVGRKIADAVGGYVSGNLFISLIAGTITFVILTILGVPYAFPLAVLVAILDLVPMVGATIATVVVTLVALSQGWIAAVIAMAVLLSYQQFENNAIQPYVYAHTVQLSPLLILVATVTGGVLGGIIGVLLAIPAASTAQIIIIELLQGTETGRRANIRHT